MTAYSEGLRLGKGYTRRSAMAGGIDVVMPGNIRDEILSIGTSFATLAKAIDSVRPKLPPDFLSGWDSYNAEWRTFSSNHASWADNLWYASYRKALEYRSGVDAWRKKFEALGGRINAPSPGADRPDPDPVSSKSGVPWKALAYGGLAIAGLYALSRTLSGAADFKREMFTNHPLAEAQR